MKNVLMIGLVCLACCSIALAEAKADNSLSNVATIATAPELSPKTMTILMFETSAQKPDLKAMSAKPTCVATNRFWIRCTP